MTLIQKGPTNTVKTAEAKRGLGMGTNESKRNASEQTHTTTAAEHSRQRRASTPLRIRCETKVTQGLALSTAYTGL